MKRDSLKILFLGNNKSKILFDWLIEQGENISFEDQKINADYVINVNPKLIISYNYPYILKKDIIDIPSKGVINLHISYLPFNRGADPNLWSFLENTKKGVTIHFIDEGVDTGKILFQKEIFFNEEEESLKSSYERLQHEMQKLFKEYWFDLKKGKFIPRKQPKEGTMHFKKDSEEFKNYIENIGWDISIKELKEKYDEFKKQ